MQQIEHYGAFFMGKNRIKKAFLFKERQKWKDSGFCVARRAKPEVRRVQSFSEAQNSLKRNLKRSAKKRSSNKIQDSEIPGSPKKSWLNVKFFWGRRIESIYA